MPTETLPPKVKKSISERIVSLMENLPLDDKIICYHQVKKYVFDEVEKEGNALEQKAKSLKEFAENINPSEAQG